jgi:hypothetical protein
MYYFLKKREVINMTPEEKKEISELISLNMTVFHARTEAKYDIIDNKLDGVHNRLDKINGSVQKHEEKLNEMTISDSIQLNENKRIENKLDDQYLHCPNTAKLNEVLSDVITKKEVKKSNRNLIIIMSIILGLFVAIQKLFLI